MGVGLASLRRVACRCRRGTERSAACRWHAACAVGSLPTERRWALLEGACRHRALSPSGVTDPDLY